MSIQKHTTGVDLSGLLTVLSKNLYSTPAVAIRELIQNAHDSITRRRLEDKGWQGPSRLQLVSQSGSGILRIIDNGSGLNEQEIHTYLATVGVGYTRTLREQSQELIGLFGLGFLSAFVIATRVTVTTTSYQDTERTWRYQSFDGETYTVNSVPAAEAIGTVIELELRKEFQHLSNPATLERLLGHYCALLKEPVYFNNTHINEAIPPWRTNNDNVVEHPVQSRKRNLEFAKKFERQFEPICTIPVKPDGNSDVCGLLWIQDGGTYSSSDNRNLSVFVRGMLLDDDARDLLPRWAGFIGGVIESNELTPTASREDLQRDQQYQFAQQLLNNALIEGLAAIAKTQKEAWRRILARHNQDLLAAALCDDRLFDLLADSVRIPTSQGDLPVASLASHGPIHISLGSNGGFEDMLFRAMQIPVAKGDLYAVHGFLRRWSEMRGGKLIEIGTELGNQQLFSEETLSEGQMAWLKQHLSNGETIVPARFKPAELPLVVVPDRDAELKQRLESDEADKRISLSALRMVRMFSETLNGDIKARLYVNLDNPAISHLLNAFQDGGDNSSCNQAMTLLRALKIVMMTGDTDKHTGETNSLNQALRHIADAAKTLATMK
ncbi:MAG TPA: ATP-binding protein [Burkholderiaceae bacterium]|jgi:molecular chaperone HtpG